jgi:hypothetical protein
MASSKLVTEKRNKLYFSKFKYRAKLRLVGVGYTYYTYDMDTYINRIERFKEQEAKWISTQFGLQDNFANISYEKIEQYFDFKHSMDKSKMTIRIEGNKVSFFSNDVSLFTPLYFIDPNLELTEAKVLSPDTLYLRRNPKFKFRTYFKGKRMPIDFPKNVINFIDMYKTVKVSRGLERFVTSRPTWNHYVYLHGSYFVDYDDESMITILHMMFGNMIGKTYSLAKQP